MLSWVAVGIAGTVAVAVVLVIGGARQDPASPAADGSIKGLTSVLSRRITPEMVRFSLEDATESAGIEFQHFPQTRRSLLPEDMGSGVAWGDYDDDGDPDLFLVNYVDEEHPSEEGRSRLYRNDGDGRFSDVSSAVGLDIALAGLGAAWGDYDNDDDLDLYITAYGPNRLFRNDGGAFVDVTSQAAVGDPSFSAGCAWMDYDADGHIDLYVANYVHFDVSEEDRQRTAHQYGSEIPFTINPSSFAPARNRLFRNNGDGSFSDVAQSAGVADEQGRSLGVVWFDFDGDGLVDLYVANDVSANGVYRNRGDGTFEDIGARSLAADYRGAMGLAVGDVDTDGDQDLFVTHWVAQENAFFDNMVSEGWDDGRGGARMFFMDSADLLGLGQISIQMVGWSAGLTDFDNDGWSDLWVVNGHTLERQDDHRFLVPQRTHLFRQSPGEGFFEIGRQACDRLDEPMVGRGGAHADYDGDGRVDLCIGVHGGRPVLLHNTTTSPGAWIRVRLRQSGANTRALGAVVSVTVNGRTQTAQIGADGSYLSQHDTDLHFGLGDASQVDRLTIRWPDGTVATRESVPVRQTLTVRRGETG